MSDTDDSAMTDLHIGSDQDASSAMLMMEEAGSSLPTVEEVKAGLPPHRASSSSNRSSTMSTVNIMDEHGTNGALMEEAGSSLPTADEVRAGLVPHQHDRRKLWYLFGAVAFVLVLFLAIYLPLSSNSPAEKRAATQQKVLKYLTAYVDTNKLEDTSSPQYKAAIWMATEDGRKVRLTSKNWLQRYALMVLFYATSPWNSNTGFATDDSECHWFTFNPTFNFYRGVFCNSNYEVTYLVLQLNNLQGSIPEELGLLTNLKELYLDYNDLNGFLPATLTKMPLLNTMTCAGNNFRGNIPTWIGDLTSMEIMGFSGNDLTGTLPQELAELTKLSVLALDNNGIVGDLGVFERMTWMERLYVDNNAFTGTMTDNFMSKLAVLERLDISNNFIEGKLARSLMIKENLTILDVSDNSLVGNLPSFPKLTGLKFLALQRNELSGTLPETVSNFLSLSHLDLSQTRINGTLPSSLGNMTNLEFLSFAQTTQLAKATIPGWVRKLTKLQEFSMKESNRIGKFPNNWSNLSSLILLDLDHNYLTGTLPASIGNLANLTFLLLHNNEFHGTLPTTFKNLLKLQMMAIDSTNITGPTTSVCFPKSILSVFIANCAKLTNCTCCTKCCEDSDEFCNDLSLLEDYGPSWQNDYTRPKFDFGPENQVKPWNRTK